jgi:hypothetical protein
MRRHGFLLPALLLTAVLVPVPAKAILIGDRYEDSIVFRFNTLVEHTNMGWGCTFALPIGGCISYTVVSTGPVDPNLAGSRRRRQ